MSIQQLFELFTNSIIIFLCQADDFNNDIMKEVREELAVPVDPEHLDIYTSLNKEQRQGFDKILNCVLNKKSQVFFVDGPGGIGKTFLYKALLGRVRSERVLRRRYCLEDAQHTQGSKSQLSLLTTTHVPSQSKVALQSYYAWHPWLSGMK